MFSSYVLSQWGTSANAVLLLALRLSAIFMMTPILYAMSIPTVVRVLLVLALSVALAAGLQPQAPVPMDAAALVQAALGEIAIGMTLALGILVAFAAFSLAGHMLDIQIGFGIAQVFDPVSRRNLPILTSAFNQIAVLVFFLVNGHHALLRGIAFSLERFQLGAGWSYEHAAPAVFAQVAGLFGLAFALAAPVVFCILLVEFALGVVARNLPQMNMFAMGIPIKIVVGLVALSFWFLGIGGVMSRVYASIYTSWNDMLVLPAASLQGPN